MSFGLPGFTMVGLPDPSVRESRDRIRSAIRNSGYEFPSHRITVNLAPADVRKAGSSFDLPIALGVLAASGVIVRRDVEEILITASCRSTAASRRRAASSQSRRRPAGVSSADCCFRRRMAPRPPWSRGWTFIPCTASRKRWRL